MRFVHTFHIMQCRQVLTLTQFGLNLQVNNNGLISFTTAVSTGHPNPFPLSENLQLVALFWGDVDTRDIGRVWYREITNMIPVDGESHAEIRFKVLLWTTVTLCQPFLSLLHGTVLILQQKFR